MNAGELTNHPWTFTDKGTGSSNPQQGEFFEGGLNLSDLGFGDTCFASFLVNTRSSQSVDSVLHDFALGQLGSCETTLTTAASLTNARSMDIGPVYARARLRVSPERGRMITRERGDQD